MILGIIVTIFLIYLMSLHGAFYVYGIYKPYTKIWTLGLYNKIIDNSTSELPKNVFNAIKILEGDTENKVNKVIKTIFIYLSINIVIFAMLLIYGILVKFNVIVVKDNFIMETEIVKGLSQFWFFLILDFVELCFTVFVSINFILNGKSKLKAMKDKIKTISVIEEYVLDETQLVFESSKKFDSEQYAFGSKIISIMPILGLIVELKKIESKYNKTQIKNIYESIFWLAQETKGNKDYNFYNLQNLIQRYKSL